MRIVGGKKYDDEGGGCRLTDCCGCYSTYVDTDLACKGCYAIVSVGEGDGCEYLNDPPENLPLGR